MKHELNEQILEKVRAFVKSECEKPDSNYKGIYDDHLLKMVPLSLDLAKKLNADLEIVEISSWFHDIGAIMYCRENHHISGAKIAKEKLSEWGYPDKKIEQVIHCILSHRSSENLIPETLEAKIVLESDNLSIFDNLSGIFCAAYVYEGLDQVQAKKAARDKLICKWNKIQFDGPRELIKPKYEAAMLLLS